MSYKSTAFLAVVLMSSACAGETPFAPGLVPGGGEGGDGGGGANTKLEPGQCWTGRDCELGEACKPSEYTESAAKNIDITESGTPGSCEAPPPEQMLMLRGISAVRFTQGGSSLDPANDDFVVEQGVFDIDFAVEAQGVTQALKIEAVELPFDPGSVGFGFYWTLDMHLRVVDPLDPDYDVECNLRFLRSGDVEGGVARGSGKVVCSTNNWPSCCPWSLIRDPSTRTAWCVVALRSRRVRKAPSARWLAKGSPVTARYSKFVFRRSRWVRLKAKQRSRFRRSW
ncbi:MAG: hypothetical protein JRJ80_21175 [Deltaproteobacteria bacterium]|nr:hypothetical protein [Deltaproteobacteria bacterium]